MKKEKTMVILTAIAESIKKAAPHPGELHPLTEMRRSQAKQ